LSFHNTMFLHYTLFRFIIPPPPRSTLFPYTTLFRSYKFMQISTPEAEPLISNTTVVFGLLMTILGLVFYSSSLSNKYVKGFYNIDRKSTRLNSSHVKISYAVFCLKKKNQHKKHHIVN